MTGRRTVVTGRGVVSPLGIGLEQHCSALVDRRSGIRQIDRLAALGLPVSRGAAIAPELLAPHAARLPRKQQKLYNRATALAIVAASLAMEDAKLANAVVPYRFGVLLGVNALWWDLEAMTDYIIAAESPTSRGELDMRVANAFCMRSINPLDFALKTLPNLAAGHLAIEHRAQGLCRAVIDGAVGGVHAIGLGMRLIAEAQLDAALCGGADAQLEPLYFASSWGMGLLASDDGSTRGAIYGEGAGLLVLEAEDHALARGARIHAEVTGYACAAGDGRLTPDQDVVTLTERLVRVIDATVKAAGSEPDALVLHGDGAAVHEEAEREALRKVFGDRGERLPRLRAKAVLGHLGVAAAPVELLSSWSLLAHADLPDTVYEGPHPMLRSARHVLGFSIGIFGECAALTMAAREA